MRRLADLPRWAASQAEWPGRKPAFTKQAAPLAPRVVSVRSATRSIAERARALPATSASSACTSSSSRTASSTSYFLLLTSYFYPLLLPPTSSSLLPISYSPQVHTRRRGQGLRRQQEQGRPGARRHDQQRRGALCGERSRSLDPRVELRTVELPPALPRQY